MDAESKRKLMGRFKAKNTKPEILVRQALHAAGLRFRLHRRGLPGTPDIILPRRKVAIFVHGCFWHNHGGCSVGKIPASQPEFWLAKFKRTKERDRSSRDELEASGWRVETIWECEATGQDLIALLKLRGLIDK